VRHVLVVEDDAQIRQVIRWALEDEGLNVVLASDGADALDRVGAGTARCRRWC